MMVHEKRLQLKQRYEFIEAKLNGALDAQEIATLSKEYAALKPVIATIEVYETAYTALQEAEALRDDPEMRELAEAEIEEITQELPQLEQALKIALLPKDDDDDKSVMLEIRPGTGGDEAGLFAGDLLRMYQRYAESQGWQFEMIEMSLSELGGVKEAVAHIEGDHVYARLKFESGVHRVQRVPETESGGRVHTSAATVAVLPEAQDVDLEINANDLRIDTMRSSGAGGQHVNTTDSAVRITHLPSGIVVTSSEKSQHRNREIAMQVLKTRLYDLERQRLDQERSADRKAQVGSGDRSERIRTYNFPQGRMTDHRINLTLYRLDQILAGELTEVIEPLVTDHQARLLAQIDE